MSTSNIITVFAQAAPQQSMGSFTFAGMMLLVFAFMYFFTIRPQRQKEKKLAEEISKLKKGDEVMLESGIYGEIHSADATSFLVKIAEKTIIKVHQRGVRLIVKSQTAETTQEPIK